MPSFILIRPTVWPQYTNVTHMATGQRSDSTGRTVLQTVAQKRAVHLRYQTFVLSVLPVSDVGSIKQTVAPKSDWLVAVVTNLKPSSIALAGSS